MATVIHCVLPDRQATFDLCPKDSGVPKPAMRITVDFNGPRFGSREFWALKAVIVATIEFVAVAVALVLVLQAIYV